MASKNINFRMPQQMIDYLSAWDNDAPLSAIIRALIERYRVITEDAMPTLTENEWCAICDILNGCGVLLSAGGHDPAPFVWAEVADCNHDKMNEKWCSCSALADKLRAMTIPARMAVWDIAARFWSHPRLEESTTREILIECGAKISD